MANSTEKERDLEKLNLSFKSIVKKLHKLFTQAQLFNIIDKDVYSFEFSKEIFVLY